MHEEYKRWIDARKRYHLSHAQIQVGRKLGLNPKKLGSLAKREQDSGNCRCPYIEELYFQQFKRSRPKNVRSIKQVVNDYNEKKQE